MKRLQIPSNIIHKRTRKKNPPIPHRADGPRPIEQFESLWDEARGSALFRGAFARATRRGWWTNSCFLMCRDGARAAKRGKKKESEETGGGGWRGAKQQSKPCRATTVARASLFTNRRSRCCFNVACPATVALLPLLNRACLLFLSGIPRKKTGNLMVVKVSISSKEPNEEGVEVEEVVRRKRGFLCCSN